MILDAATARTSFIRGFWAYSSHSIFPTFCHLRSLCTMKELEMNVSSGLPVVSDENVDVLPPIAVRSDQRGSSSKVQSTPEIEKKYVHHVYDAIALHFSSTRFAKWPKVQTFLNSLPSGSLILDAGCGNGKYLGLNPRCYFIGNDISAPLVSICADRNHEVLVADAVNLPYRTGYGDAAISIAVLHHLSTESRRKKAVEELIRVVKPCGLVLITVWAREQEDKSLVNKWTPLPLKYSEEWVGPGSPRIRNTSASLALESIPETEENDSVERLKNFPLKSRKADLRENVTLKSTDGDHALAGNNEKCGAYQQEYFVPWHLPYHRTEVSGDSASALANGLARKDDKKGAIVYDRYYHVFSEGELESLLYHIKDCFRNVNIGQYVHISQHGSRKSRGNGMTKFLERIRRMDHSAAIAEYEMIKCDPVFLSLALPTSSCTFLY